MEKIQYLSDLKNEIIRARQKYKYQKELADKLDQLVGDFTVITLLEITLWKLNRYPTITQEILEGINDLRKRYSNGKAKVLLLKLLQLRGYDLPMASTILRFAVPDKLQIIDQRVYRFITKNDYLKLPYNKEEKVTFYFEYIEELKSICKKYNIKFSEADRILYQLDKDHNKGIKLKTS